MRRGGLQRYNRRKAGSSNIEIPEPGEDELQEAVLRLLGYLGVMADSTHDTKSRLPAEYEGRSDIRGILPDGHGRSLVLELKAPGKFPTPKQLDYIERARAHGALAFWADNIEWVKEQVVGAIREGRRGSAPAKVKPREQERSASRPWTP